MSDKAKNDHDWVDRHLSNPDNIPVATKEETAFIENTLYKLCKIYFDQIESLSEKRYCACIQRAMHFDVERGLIAGQVPHIRYIHSEWFTKWDKELWDKINARMDNVSDDFFKIL